MARFNEMVALEASVKMSTAHYCTLAGWTKHEADSRAERLRFKMDGDYENYDHFLNNIPKHRSHSSEKLVLHAQFVARHWDHIVAFLQRRKMVSGLFLNYVRNLSSHQMHFAAENSLPGHHLEATDFGGVGEASSLW